MRYGAAVLCALFGLTQVAWPGVAAFQLHHGGSSPPSAIGETVRLLVRTVDASDPYYRSMSFFVPKELNYMLGEYLHKNFSSMLERHCNVTNITMLVRNDVQLLLTDYDVWTMRNGDRIEIWSKLSGRPTRAQTAMAFTQKFRRPDRQDPCVAGSPCQRRRENGDRWKTAGGDDGAVVVPEESDKMTVGVQVNIPPEPVVVPDWSQMP